MVVFLHHFGQLSRAHQGKGKEGSTVTARLLSPRGIMCPRVLDGRCSWDTICSLSGNLERGRVPVFSCFGVLSPWAFLAFRCLKS